MHLFSTEKMPDIKAAFEERTGCNINMWLSMSESQWNCLHLIVKRARKIGCLEFP